MIYITNLINPSQTSMAAYQNLKSKISFLVLFIYFLGGNLVKQENQICSIQRWNMVAQPGANQKPWLTYMDVNI